jgi:hypothetical protein
MTWLWVLHFFGLTNLSDGEVREYEELQVLADQALGGYARANVQTLEGRYVCFRPTFANPSIVSAYLTSIRWDVEESCLVFEESARADVAPTKLGRVCIPVGKPFINLVTMDRGDVRLITLSRPDQGGGLAFGLSLSLSNPSGVQFLAASAPIVLQKLDEGTPTPHLGFIHPGAPDYDSYQSQLQKVLNYATLGQNHALDVTRTLDNLSNERRRGAKK